MLIIYRSYSGTSVANTTSHCHCKSPARSPMVCGQSCHDCRPMMLKKRSLFSESSILQHHSLLPVSPLHSASLRRISQRYESCDLLVSQHCNVQAKDGLQVAGPLSMLKHINADCIACFTPTRIIQDQQIPDQQGLLKLMKFNLFS